MAWTRWDHQPPGPEFHDHLQDGIEEALSGGGNGGSQTVIWLVSDGAGDYQPETSSGMSKADAQASTLPKVFTGPTDPTTVAGWTLTQYDAWKGTSA